jgi:hypothetical protein
VPSDVQHKGGRHVDPGHTSADETGFGLWTAYASLPDHGANAPDVTYHIDYGVDSTGQPPPPVWSSTPALSWLMWHTVLPTAAPSTIRQTGHQNGRPHSAWNGPRR